MRHAEEPEDDSMPGQDSFIDVICNMVGILITLVVVVGMRVTQMVIEPATQVTTVAARTEPAGDATKLRAELDESLRVRRDAVDEIETAMTQAIDMRANAALVEVRREQLSLVRAEVEQAIAQRRAKLDAKSQKQFDVQREIAQSQIKLNALMQEQVSLVSAPTDVEEVESIPTPLAKKITGERIMVRLKHGQLAVIPVEELRHEVESRGVSYLRGGLADRNEASDLYGPIDGFRMRLSVQRIEEEVPSDASASTPRRAGLVQNSVLLPTADDIGMPVEQALLPNSQFSLALRARRSATGAVLVCVYPDSYAALRSLKKAMWEASVPLAVQPLPEGYPIIISSVGGESAAQ